jgi:hypothetical protein
MKFNWKKLLISLLPIFIDIGVGALKKVQPDDDETTLTPEKPLANQVIDVRGSSLDTFWK